MESNNYAVRIIRFAVTLAALSAAAATQAQAVCTAGHAPDAVRIVLSTECGAPDRIEVRRNGDDKNRLFGTKQGGVWLLEEPFTDSIGSVKLCSKVCGFASTCVAGKPKHDRAANGDNICVAEYRFDCDESAWTLAVQSKPAATLAYTRRHETQEQRGVLKSGPLKAIEMCDLAPDERVSITPQTKTTYTFKAIPVSFGELDVLRGKVLTLRPANLKKFVVPPAAVRSSGQSQNEDTFVQLDLKELTLMIAPSKPGGNR